MKTKIKIIKSVTALMVMLLLVNCSNDDHTQPNEPDYKNLKFNVDVIVKSGYNDDESTTRAVKQGWKAGDQIVAYFNGSADRFLLLKYSNANTWERVKHGISSLPKNGTVQALYATDLYFVEGWGIDEYHGDMLYTDEGSYEINAETSTVYITLNMNRRVLTQVTVEGVEPSGSWMMAGTNLVRPNFNGQIGQFNKNKGFGEGLKDMSDLDIWSQPAYDYASELGDLPSDVAIFFVASKGSSPGTTFQLLNGEKDKYLYTRTYSGKELVPGKAVIIKGPFGAEKDKWTVTEKSVAVTGVTLNKTTLSLVVGANETLSATVAPTDATNKNVSWKSSSIAVATVDASGKVTAVKAGSATITATTEDGAKTATCAVTVTAAPDTQAPTVANKTITVSNLTASNVKLSWNAASDNVTEASKLKYKVYYGEGGDMTDIYVCENNADGNSGYLTGATSYTYSGSLNSTMSFNVVVEDEAGNKTAYTHKNVRYEAGSVFAADAAIFDGTTGKIIGAAAVMNSDKQTRMLVYIGNKNTGAHYPYTDAEWSSSNTSVARIETPAGNNTVILAWSNGASTISVKDKSGNTLSFNLTIQQGGEGGEGGEAGIPPTSVSFARSVIYLWHGNTADLGMTVTPAGADLSQITWTQEPSPYISSAERTSLGHWYTKVTYGSHASHGSQYATITATCPNGASAQVQLRARFNMGVSTTMSPFTANWFNVDANYSWIKSASKIYVRAYYGVNQTQWNQSNSASKEQYLNKINASMYSITSNDPDITATPMADGVTWELTRHNFDTLKEVTLTITCGRQSYTQVLTLLKN